MAIRGSLYKSLDLEFQEATTASIGNDGDIQSSLLNANGLQVTFLSESKGIINTRLEWPVSANGSYYFDSTDGLQLGKYIYIKAEEEKWVAHSTTPAFFRDSRGQILYRVELTHGSIYNLQNAGSDYIVFAEFFNERSNVFHNYRIERYSDISIGRTPDNDIQYNNPLVSRLHATLRWDRKEWVIRDQNSTNVVYVNNKRVQEAALNPGDSIFIVGLRINVGFGFISVNDENGRITMTSRLRKVAAGDASLFPEIPFQEQKEEQLFNRLPRKREPLKAEPIIIDAPPMPLNNDGIPLILRMGGSMTMGTTSLLTGHFTSLLSSVLFPVLNQKYTEKQKKEYESKRQIKYGKYLNDLKLQIRREADYEKAVLNTNYPKLSEVITFADDGKRLWERRTIDDDFLDIRIGYGRIPLIAERNYSERRFDMDEDNLLDQMYQIAEEPVSITSAPIMTSLIKDYVCGLQGNRDLLNAFITRFIMQLTILHSYDEVKLVVLAKAADFQNIKFIRYLPHIWNDRKDIRFLATNTAEASQISEYLKNELDKDIQKPRDLKEILKERAYYVVIAFDKKIFDSMEILKDVMRCDNNCGVSVITAFDELPKECMKVFYLSDNGKHAIVHLNEIDQPDEFFQMDDYITEQAERCMKTICNISLRAVAQAYSLPKMVTFLEMYGVGNVEQLNPTKRWEENNPLKSLAAPIGIATDGELFTLDLHEKFQGPHGLIAGMTGSGKSEFIITYILSMAVSYSPDEVAFILIDYKGGGLAGAFEDEARGIHLPHLVGTITNLDGNAIHRSMMALKSELRRRQRIFNEAKSAANEGTMDIYGYQRLYRNGKVKEPIPHLFVISDEFAELKAQEPDFMDDLVSTARIGRSLGVHLILATQKPAGVVNDQINSNSKFRVCLKVQTRMDSEEMLRRPEAAEIKETGRFYLQVGYNEFFALGQSAWCGADYEPQEEVIVHRDESVQIIDSVGQDIFSAKPAQDKNKSGVSQLVAIVQYLTQLANEKRIVPRRLWTESMPTRICLEKLREEYQNEEVEDYRIVLGMIDDPENQKQFPMVMDFYKIRNLMVVGTNRTGKTTLVESILIALSEKHSPEDVNYYILDYSSRMLKVFQNSPHCGGAWGEGDEKQIEKFFSMLQDIIDERKELFSKALVSTFDAYREVNRIPLIIVVIDNFTGLSSWAAGEEISRKIHMYMREGNSVGVSFIVTATAYDDIRYQAKREFDTRILYNANSKFEFGDILGAKPDYFPGKNPGRGMCRVGDRALEIQIAQFSTGMIEKERIQKVVEFNKSLRHKYKDSKTAKRIKIFDETETYESFIEDIARGRIPLGYAVADVKKISIPFRQFFCMSLYFGNPFGKLPVLKNYVTAMVREKMQFVIVKASGASVFDTEEIQETLNKGNSTITYLTASENDSERFVQIMIDQIGYRKQYRNQYCELNNISSSSTEVMKKCHDYMMEKTVPLIILFESFAEFCKSATDRCTQCMQQIMANGRGYNFYFMACYGPDEDSQIRSNAIQKCFNPDHFILLYGGQFDKQGLVNLPMEYRRIDKPSKKYNSFLMQYRGGLFPLLMPCGDLEKNNSNPDEEDIIA